MRSCERVLLRRGIVYVIRRVRMGSLHMRENRVGGASPDRGRRHAETHERIQKRLKGRECAFLRHHHNTSMTNSKEAKRERTLTKLIAAKESRGRRPTRRSSGGTRTAIASWRSIDKPLASRGDYSLPLCTRTHTPSTAKDKYSVIFLSSFLQFQADFLESRGLLKCCRGCSHWSSRGLSHSDRHGLLTTSGGPSRKRHSLLFRAMM